MIALSKWRGLGLVAAILVGSAPVAALADPVTYTYTGDDFTSFSLPSTYTSSDSVTGSITLTSALADNIGTFFAEPAAAIASFTFSDGQHTITSANATGSSFSFKTDASGNIIDWQVVVDIGAVAVNSISTINAPSTSGVYDDGLFQNSQGENRNSPGTWVSSLSSTPTDVPEPASIALLCIGLVGLIGLGKIRRLDPA